MNATRMSVGLLFGGTSPEHEVSIVSARSIASRLDTKRFDVMPIGIARNGVWAVKGDPFSRLAAGELPEHSGFTFMPLEKGAEDFQLPDVFFNAIHGAQGEDGQIQGFLDILGRPCTGSGRMAMGLTMDKWMTKRVWQSEGLPVVPYVGITEEEWTRSREYLINRALQLGLPLFIKPANLGSSIGIEKVKDASRLGPALDAAFSFDRRVLVEQGIDARELEVAALGGADPVISPVGEVLVAGEFYDFNDKYVDGKSSVRIPAEGLPDELSERIRVIAARAFTALDAYGMGRIDFFLCRRTWQIYLNEINTIPGFTSISMYPKLMEAAGIHYDDLLTRLIDLAMDRHRGAVAKLHDFKSGSDWYK